MAARESLIVHFTVCVPYLELVVVVYQAYRCYKDACTESLELGYLHSGCVVACAFVDG